MTFKQLWELGEIYTAPLNLFLILLGASFAKGEFGVFGNWRLVVYIFTIVFFHIAVNIFNNYMDYQNASEEHDYKEASNIIGREGLSLPLVKGVFYGFMAASGLLGLILVMNTNWFLVIIGFIGYYVGLFYSAGPRPLNSLPIAETVTSIASGFLVPFVAAYVVSFPTGEFSLTHAGQLFLVCLPPVLMMFNNLLANNTCDLKEDIVNGRKTLVYYIGQPKAVRLLQVFFLLSFGLLPVLVLLGLAPWPVLVLILLVPKLWQQLKGYFGTQDKQKTFPLVLKSMASIMVGYPMLYFIGVLF